MPRRPILNVYAERCVYYRQGVKAFLSARQYCIVIVILVSILSPERGERTRYEINEYNEKIKPRVRRERALGAARARGGEELRVKYL